MFIPLGIPFVVAESVVRFISFSGLTKLNTTRFTEGEPLPRSMIPMILRIEGGHVQAAGPTARVGGAMPQTVNSCN